MDKNRMQINRELAKLRGEHPGIPMRLSIRNEKGDEMIAGTEAVPRDVEDYPGRYSVIVHAIDKSGKLSDEALFKRELVIEEEEPEAEEPPPAPADPATSVLMLVMQQMNEMREEMREVRERAEAKQAEVSATLVAMVTSAADERVKQSHAMHMEMMKLARLQVRSGTIQAEEEEQESPLAELGRMLLPVVKENLPLIIHALGNRGAKTPEAPE